MKQLNLIIADDHPIFLKGLREGLEMEDDFKVVAQANNGLEAWHAVQTHRADVVVLDIDMPRMNGLEAAEKMLEQNPKLPIILLTMHKEKAPLLKALELGICGYVLKENAVTDIMHAIRMVAEGNPYISPEMSAFLLRKPQTVQKQKTQEAMELLTPAERQITQLIAQYKTSKEIADELFISEKTVFNHRMNISKKLNLTGKNSLLRFALEHFA
ncbi:DNA-binding response regulator [Adhaeribacter arboris]|uniref:DNA-binding response regulator n=1 Tax=Adhaeribacter arboris TaxID=2072846 RepID=A0A2T2YD30_9BACT|nr:response regulator transcription factor [Adhaeribacter arboris]PSR53431.1 DNA-binding response regulator [Adhaeribacter arboris]